MESRVFCRIVAGEEPASYVYRDDVCTAFLDVQPVNPGHALVVPNRHAASLADLDDGSGSRMMHVARRVAAALRDSGLRCEGINLWMADGEAAGQDVFHSHLHVIPRFHDDGFGLVLPSNYAI